MRKSTLALAAALAVGGCGGTYTRSTHWVIHRDAVNRFSIRYPDTWHPAAINLTPHLADPHEIFTVSTGPVPAGGGGCAQVPTAALRAMGPRGALVTIQERARSHGEPRRPDRFALHAADRSEASGCVPHARFRSWILSFRDRGRAFDAVVALGNRVSAHTRRLALHVLDSFRPAAAR